MEKYQTLKTELKAILVPTTIATVVTLAALLIVGLIVIGAIRVI